ncbi:hypothetical protein HPB47_016809 [Ixodes persulcatus]|uniref:Uncharacterized protein n=1 Tax=Ixodes persulcatus TaxID=34615 RepID=A0AC60R354_IXOPE|nr:hypothetical protein HPB47_016809 [Ixodes persulcatus]
MQMTACFLQNRAWVQRTAEGRQKKWKKDSLHTSCGNRPSIPISPSPKPKMAKKRQALSLETKQSIVKDVESGTKKASVAAKYNVADTTVSAVWKNREQVRKQLQQDSASLSRKRIRTSKHEGVDEASFRWFREARAKNARVSGPMLQAKAKSFGHLFEHKGFDPLNGWIQRFKDRNGISCKVISGETTTIQKCFRNAGFVRDAGNSEDADLRSDAIDEAIGANDVWSDLVAVLREQVLAQHAPRGELSLAGGAAPLHAHGGVLLPVLEQRAAGLGHEVALVARKGSPLVGSLLVSLQVVL